MAKGYRFRDLVALNTWMGTVYLPPTEARKLARSLNAAARSIIDKEPFGTSDVPGVEVADYVDVFDADLVAKTLARDRIKTRETSPGHWRAFYRGYGARWVPVKSDAGPIDYTSPQAALSAAILSYGKQKMEAP